MISFDFQKKLKNRSHTFNLDVSVRTEAETLFLWGASGSGKTTILNLIAGIIKPDRGRCFINGHCWEDTVKKFSCPVYKRPIGYLFQDIRLFPGMTVEENIMYPMKKKDKNFLDFLLQATGLQDAADSSVTALSGGQKQRVGLARALARKPEVLLLDEPFSSLDFKKKEELIDIYLSLQSTLGFSGIVVTHAIKDAFLLKGHLVELSNGGIRSSTDICELAHDLRKPCYYLNKINLKG